MTKRHNTDSNPARAGAVLRSCLSRAAAARRSRRVAWARSLGGVSLAIVVASCSGSDSTGPVPEGLVLEAGSATALAGDVGDAVNPVPRVRVRRGAEPAAGVAVTFSVSTGGGRVLQTSVSTDASGDASPGEWVLGTSPGPQTLTVTSASVPGRSIVFTATAAPAEPTRMRFIVPPSLSAAGRAIAPAVQVAITDEYGNQVESSAVVTVALASGPAGALTGTRSIGAATGIATFADLRVSATGTGYRLVASSPGLPATTSDPFDVVAGGAAGMAVFQGTGQTAAAGAAVPVPPAVKLLDADGNPVSGATVTFAAANGGKVTGATAATDGNGVARAGEWRLGTVAGIQALTASTTAVSVSPANFSATATAGAPSAGRSSVEALTSSVPAGTQSTIRVTVRDQYDNPVSAATVVIAATGTGNTVGQPPATGADGRANGGVSSTKAESKTISVSAGGVSITQTALLTVTPGPIATVAIAQAPQVSVNVNATVQLAATAQDQFGNGIANPSISWSSVNPGAAVATVSSSGLVTGVAPISTTIRATANGKTGSALVAVYGAAQPKGITYCTPDDTPVKLDMYFPNSGFPRPRPTVIYIHGGGWTFGNSLDADELSELRDSLMVRGYVFASLNYRLAPVNPWPAQGKDVRCAVRFLRAKAFEYGVNPSMLLATGRSAGGQLAALLGTQVTPPYADTDEHTGLSSNVQAVASTAGVYDLTEPSELNSIPNGVFGSWPNNATTDYIIGASPEKQVSPGDAQFLMFHGALDDDVLPTQATEMHQALVSAGVLSSLVMAQDADHGFFPVPPATATVPRFLAASPGSGRPIMALIVDFFDDVVAGPAAVASFRSAVSAYSSKVPPHTGPPRPVKRRFLESF